MIESLDIMVPSYVVPRDSIDPVLLAPFEKLTGIKKTRRFSGDLTSFMEACLPKADIDCKNVKSVIVITQTPTRLSPCMAMEAMRIMGLPADIPAFDMNQSCCGWIYGLYVASQFAYAHGNCLLICADMLRFGSGTEGLIFSDACSVALINGNVGNLKNAYFFNDPKGAECLYSTTLGDMKMDGGAVFDFVTRFVSKELEKYLSRMSGALIPTYLAQHQSNLSMMKMLEKRSAPKLHSLHSIEEYGNQSMNSIPTAIASNEQKVLASQILLLGYGAGYSAAMGILQWPSHRISNIIEV